MSTECIALSPNEVQARTTTLRQLESTRTTTDDKESLHRAIDADRKRLCDALGLKADGKRYFCPKCQNDGEHHATGDLSIEAGFKCHKCNWKGDGYDLVQEVRHCSFPEALAFVRKVYGVGDGTPQKRAVDAPKANKVHLTLKEAARAAAWGAQQSKGIGYVVARTDIYKNAEGVEVAAVLRLDAEGGKAKEYRPVRRVEGGWQIGDPPGLWPLFKLPEIIKEIKPSVVCVCEGEKAASAGAGIGLNCTTSAHGAASPDKTDWTPLHGHHVFILPDNDDAGRGYAEAVARLCHKAGAACVKIVELPGLPPKGDMFEFAEAGGTAADVLRLVGEVKPWKPEPEAAEEEDEKHQATATATDKPEACTGATSATKTIDELAAQRFDPAKPPPPLEPILTFRDTPVGTAGNLVALTGQAGTAKSHSLAAILASGFTDDELCDCLGWRLSNPDGLAVFYFDFEMSRQDNHAMLSGALKRAGVEVPPPWFHGYHLTGTDPYEARKIVDCAFRYGAKHFAGTRAVFLDGIADLASSPNDEEECFSLIRLLHKLAIDAEALFVAVLHLNPGSDFKTRGHLGSQLERKAETVLTTARDGDVFTVYATKTRHKPISKVQGQRFSWDDGAGRFTSVNTVAETRMSAAAEARRKLAQAIFAGQGRFLRYGIAVGRICELEAISPDAAKKRLAKLRADELVEVNPASGEYCLPGEGLLL